MPRFQPIRTPTLPEAIAEQIAQMIADGHFKPGDRLPTETELMRQFGVGRSSLREALKSLAIAGIIETRRSAGSFVSQTYTGFLRDRLNWAAMLSERELNDLVDVRCALEGQTAALAAVRATPSQRAALADLIATMETQARQNAHEVETDMTFHVTIAEAAHNPLLLGLFHSIRNLVYGYMKWDYPTDPARTEARLSEHRRIFLAIQAGQPDVARQAMLDHLAAGAQWTLPRARERRKLAQRAPESVREARE